MTDHVTSRPRVGLEPTAVPRWAIPRRQRATTSRARRIAAPILRSPLRIAGIEVRSGGAGRGPFAREGFGIGPMVLPEPFRGPTRRLHPLHIEIDRCISPVGFTFGRHGWHPLQATAERWLADPDLPYEETPSWALWTRFRPRTIQEAIFASGTPGVTPFDRLPAWLASQLWTLSRPTLARYSEWKVPSALPAARYEHFGPAPDAYGRRSYERLARFHHSLVRAGYRPGDHRTGCVEGYFLSRGDDYRFVVTEGQHRLAMLAAHGARHVVAVPRFELAGVDRARLARWGDPTRGGFGREATATAFDALFDADGRAKREQFRL